VEQCNIQYLQSADCYSGGKRPDCCVSRRKQNYGRTIPKRSGNPETERRNRNKIRNFGDNDPRQL